MKQYIDKDTLIAEIERLIDSHKPLKTLDPTYCEGLDDSLDDVLSFIDTLEVKEVNLDEEFDKYCETLYLIDLENEPYSELFECAKHFFELGLKSKNE